MLGYITVYAAVKMVPSFIVHKLSVLLSYVNYIIIH